MYLLAINFISIRKWLIYWEITHSETIIGAAHIVYIFRIEWNGWRRWGSPPSVYESTLLKWNIRIITIEPCAVCGASASQKTTNCVHFNLRTTTFETIRALALISWLYIRVAVRIMHLLRRSMSKCATKLIHLQCAEPIWFYVHNSIRNVSHSYIYRCELPARERERKSTFQRNIRGIRVNMENTIHGKCVRCACTSVRVHDMCRAHVICMRSCSGSLLLTTRWKAI